MKLPVAAGSAKNPGASAQPEAGCHVYDQCALRVQHHILSTWIVRGAEETRVARIGFRPPRLQGLFQASEPAALAFRQFRSHHARSSWLAILGGLEIVGGMVARANGKDDWALGLSIGGTVFELAAGIFRMKANEHLSTSIWWYNQPFAEGRLGR